MVRFTNNPYEAPETNDHHSNEESTELRESNVRWPDQLRGYAFFLLGVPSLFLVPLAIWLARASFFQVVASRRIESFCVLLISLFGVIGFFCLWWYLLLGYQKGSLGKIQMLGVFFGVLALSIAVLAQIGAFRG